MATAGICASRAHASGTTYNYIGVNGSLWTASGNWSPGSGPPGLGDTADFQVSSASPFVLNFGTAVLSGTGLVSLFIDPFGAGSLTLSQTNAGSLMKANNEFIGNFDSPVSTYTQSTGENDAGTLSIGSAGSGNGVYNLSSTGTNVVSTQLILASSSNSTGIYNLSGSGILNTVNALVPQYVGSNGAGTFNQSGGSNQAYTLFLGYSASGTGTYNLSAGTLDAGSTQNGNEQIGYGGVGVFNQTGGSNKTFSIAIGAQGGRGTYGMSNASTLTVTGAMSLGNSSPGVFNQSGGTVNTPLLFIGNFSAGSGTYNLSGGSVLVNSSTGSNGLYIGLSGKAVFNQNGGTLTVSGTSALGYGSTSSGVFNQTNGTTSFNGGLTVGQSGSGVFVQSGGSVLANTMYISVGSAATGSYTLSGTTSSLNANGNSEYIGEGGTAIFNQSGGSNTALLVFLGDAATGVGTYNLSNTATLTVGNPVSGIGALIVGQLGKGIFNQTGGSNIITSLVLSDAATSSSGTFNLSGGILQAKAVEYIGGVGFGLFSQTSGANSAVTLAMGLLPGAGGTYTQSGGQTLISGTVYLGGYSNGAGGVGILNVNGGTFSATNTITLFGNNSTFNIGGGTVSAGNINVGTTGNAAVVQTAGNINGVLVSLGAGTGVTGTYTMSGASSTLSLSNSTFGGEIDVGQYGTGLFNQSGGTVTTQALVLGDNTGTFGTYNLSNSASLTVNGPLDVGVNGSGVFDQTGGSNTINFAALSLGFSASSSGTYTLGGGNLSSPTIYIGYSGKGVFNQSGGTNSTGDIHAGDVAGSIGTYTQSGGIVSASTLHLGENANASGTYNLSGASSLLNVTNASHIGEEYLGQFGTALINQSGGTNVTDYLHLGDNASGFGTYNLSNSASLVVNQEMDIGYLGSAVFNQTGGSATASSLILGTFAASSGTYNLGGGNLTVASEQFSSSGKSLFNQTGGTNSVGNLAIAGSSDGVGTYTQSAGLTSISGTAYVGGSSFGAGGTGVANINGGTFSATNSINVLNSNSTFNVSGGTVTAGRMVLTDWSNLNFNSGALNLTTGVSSNTGNLIIGTTGNSVLNQSGGSVSAAALTLATGTSSTSTYNLSGANSSLKVTTSFQSGNVVIGLNGTGIFNQSGGSNVIDGMTLGYNSGSLGTYSLSNSASLSSDAVVAIGGSGKGVFNQTGGTFNASYYLGVGFSASSSGTYNLSGGNLLAGGSEYIGAGGKGVFNQIGGTHSASSISVAGFPGSTGTYSQSGGQVLVSGGVYVGGYDNNGLVAGGTGTVNINGGTFSATGSVTVFNNNSFFYVNGGTVTTSQVVVPDWSRFQVKFGTANLGNGSSTNTGGWVIGLATGTATVNELTSGGVVGVDSLTLSDISSGTANYNLGTGATLNVGGDEVLNGFNTTTANFTQSGGTHTIAGALELGANNSSLGTFTLSGGTVTVSGNTYIGGNSSFGASGVGLLNISGGKFTAGTNTTLTVYNTVSGTNASGITMTAGTLTAINVANAGRISIRGGTATLQALSGTGTLTVGGAGTALVTINSLTQTTVTVTNGGQLTIGTVTGAPISWGSNPGGFSPHPTIIPGATIGTLTITNGGSVIFSTTTGSGTPYVKPYAGTLPTNRITQQINTLILPYTTGGSANAFKSGGDFTGTITPQGTLDIGNHQVLLNTPTAQSVRDVQLLVAAGYNASNYGAEDGSWNGKGIASSVAKSSFDSGSGVSKFAIGYAYGGDASTQAEQGGGADNTNTSLDGVGPNQTIVRSVLLGDVNMDGNVDFADIASILGYHYNDNQPAHYTDGDINNHGIVNFDDIALVLAYNYNSGQKFPGQTAAQAQAKATAFQATAASVHRSAVAAALTPTGKPGFIYNPSTGDLTFVLNGFKPLTKQGDPSYIAGLSITSANSLLIPLAVTTPFAEGIGATLWNNYLAAGIANGTGFADGVTSNSFDLGDILPTGLSTADINSDLTLKYQVLNDGLPQATGLTGAVPEPSSLMVIGIGAMGMMSRRRKR